MPPAMERRPLQDRSIFNVNDNLVSRKTSAIVQPVQKENRPLYMSPVLPGTGSVTHNVTRLLSNKENSDGTGTPEISTYQSGYTNISATAKELFRTPKGNDVSSTSEGKTSYEHEDPDHSVHLSIQSDHGIHYLDFVSMTLLCLAREKDPYPANKKRRRNVVTTSLQRRLL